MRGIQSHSHAHDHRDQAKVIYDYDVETGECSLSSQFHVFLLHAII